MHAATETVPPAAEDTAAEKLYVTRASLSKRFSASKKYVRRGSTFRLAEQKVWLMQGLPLGRTSNACAWFSTDSQTETGMCMYMHVQSQLLPSLARCLSSCGITVKTI